MRICTTCWKNYPDSQFRRRRRDGALLRRECRSCHNRAEQLRRAARRDRTLTGYLAKLASPRPISATALEALTSAVLRRLGGLDNFVEGWARHIEGAPGSQRAVRACSALWRGLLQARRIRAEHERKAAYEELTRAIDSANPP